MGIRKDIEFLIPTALDAIGKQYNEVLICELGNQRMRYGKFKTHKEYLQSKGADVVYIDWNRKDDSIKLDLSMPINIFKESFDIVTNYGTSEHVANQENCFRNIDYFCKIGGAMIHAIALTRTYKEHGLYYYTIEFFEKLARANNYVIVINTTLNRGIDKTSVCAVLLKTQPSFMWSNDEGLFRL